MKFDGPDYQKEHDCKRLTTQHERIKALMIDGKFRTLSQISNITGDPPASISAQLRHLRKERFGGYTVLKRRKGLPEHGLFEYRLVLT